MKKLVLASLITLAASQAAGCIIEGGGEEDAYISATWELRNIATNTPTLCPVGFDTAALYNQPTSGLGGPNAGAVIIDLFDCDDNAATSAPLPPTTYLTWIEIATRNNSQVYAKSLSAPVDVTFSDKTFSAQILNDGGYFQLAWALKGASSNAPLECAGAGVTGGVEVVATEIADPNNFNSDIYDCIDHYGVTAGYRAGTYSLSIDAFDAGNNQLGQARLNSSTINRQNAVTMLGTIEIPITGR